MKSKHLLMAVIIILLILIIGAAIMFSFWKKDATEIAIEKTLRDIHSDFKGIKSEFPQLSEIDNAKMETGRYHYSYTYEKGFGGWSGQNMTQGPIIEENGCRIKISIEYPERRGEGGPPVPPMFGGDINGKILAGMVFVDAELTPQGENFKNKVKEIIYSRLKEMESKLKVEITHNPNFFPVEAAQIGLMQPFTLKAKESVVVKANEETSVKITLANVVIESVEDPYTRVSSQNTVSGKILFEEGDFKQEVLFAFQSKEVVKSVGRPDDPKGFNLRITNVGVDKDTIWLKVQLDRIGRE